MKNKIDFIFYIDVDLDLPKQLLYLVDKTLCLENTYLEVVALSSSIKKTFLNIFQNLENTCAGVSFLIKLQARSVQLH